MKITIIGAGYVGLTTGAAFVETGQTVDVYDINKDRIEGLRKGIMPFYEIGLSDLVNRGLRSGKLAFYTGSPEIKEGIVICCVGTPLLSNGTLDTSAIKKTATYLAESGFKGTFIIKSTVTVGTTAKIADILGLTAVDTVMIPEFLREGTAVADALRPDRIVIGLDSDLKLSALGERNFQLRKQLTELFDPFTRNGAPILFMSWREAEFSKLASNAYLAMRISYVNELAMICKHYGMNVDAVRRAVGTDKRIGTHFFYPGIGWGGACFPKDVQDYITFAYEAVEEHSLIAAADEINNAIVCAFGNLVLEHVSSGKLAVWGVSFKAGTSDTRYSPSERVMGLLSKRGKFKFTAYDPEASCNLKTVTQVADMYEACNDAKALLVLTDWPEFRRPDYATLKSKMKNPVIFDGRNMLDALAARAAGFSYFSVGRP